MNVNYCNTLGTLSTMAMTAGVLSLFSTIATAQPNVRVLAATHSNDPNIGFFSFTTEQVASDGVAAFTAQREEGALPQVWAYSSGQFGQASKAGPPNLFSACGGSDVQPIGAALINLANNSVFSVHSAWLNFPYDGSQGGGVGDFAFLPAGLPDIPFNFPRSGTNIALAGVINSGWVVQGPGFTGTFSLRVGGIACSGDNSGVEVTSAVHVFVDGTERIVYDASTFDISNDGGIVLSSVVENFSTHVFQSALCYTQGGSWFVSADETQQATGWPASAIWSPNFLPAISNSAIAFRDFVRTSDTHEQLGEGLWTVPGRTLSPVIIVHTPDSRGYSGTLLPLSNEPSAPTAEVGEIGQPWQLNRAGYIVFSVNFVPGSAPSAYDWAEGGIYVGRAPGPGVVDSIRLVTLTGINPATASGFSQPFRLLINNVGTVAVLADHTEDGGTPTTSVWIEGSLGLVAALVVGDQIDVPNPQTGSPGHIDLRTVSSISIASDPSYANGPDSTRPRSFNEFNQLGVVVSFEAGELGSVSDAFMLISEDDCRNFVCRRYARCYGDFNCDGNTDSGDVDAILNAVAGNDSQCYSDINDDGNIDQGDVDEIISIIAGGAPASCPY